MKYFIAIALIAAVASAGIIKPTPALAADAEIQEIIAAISSPSTDPATAALLEQMLLEVLGLFKPEPIQVGPAIVEPAEYEPIHVGPAIVEPTEYEPIHVGPALIDFPLPEGALGESPSAPAPVAPAPIGSSSPLVQIIVNVQQAQTAPVQPNPVEVIDSKPTPIVPEIIPTPVQVVEQAPADPEPILIVDGPLVAPDPVIVVEESPAAPEPVNVAPIIVAPVVVAPEILN